LARTATGSVVNRAKSSTVGRARCRYVLGEQVDQHRDVTRVESLVTRPDPIGVLCCSHGCSFVVVRDLSLSSAVRITVLRCPAMSSLIDIALGPVRFAMALPKLVEGIERLPDIADSLVRIADFEESLEGLAGLADSLAGLAVATQGLGALAAAVEQLERVAGDLTQAVQPLQGVAQRLNRFGRGLGSPTS
jgi:hypothetical protein